MQFASTVILLFTAALASACESDETPFTVPQDSLHVELVASGLNGPVYLTAPNADQRLFFVEQPGRIRIIQNGQVLSTPFLDIRSKVLSGGEQGLLSLAFHPNYAVNGFFFVYYTDLAGDNKVERYRVSTADASVADATSAKLILPIPHPVNPNHNGGQLQFGADGKLYIAVGDGGSGGDPLGNGQNRSTILGDLLRIDVDAGDPYAIPPDNPYATSTQFRPEIWAYGLRNPWRFSFDRVGGVIYIADVGQNAFEEINAVPSTLAGVNYGWRIMEGMHCYNADTCNQAGLRLPVHEYGRNLGGAVTGGYVYRGTRMPGLQGLYFYSDYTAGGLRSFRLVNGAATEHRTWPVSVNAVTSFGQDAAGELYILSALGTIHRIVP